METTKMYRLKHNLPKAKENDIYEWDGEYYTNTNKNSDVDSDDYQLTKDYVENNPDWFEELKPEKNVSEFILSKQYSEKSSDISIVNAIFTMKNITVDELSKQIENGLNGCEFTKEDMIDFAHAFYANIKQNINSNVHQIFNMWYDCHIHFKNKKS